MAETPTENQPKLRASAFLASVAARAPAVAMLSHCGRVRHGNQDACAALPELGAFVVCDGMGGAAAGEVASQLAVEAFLHTVSQSVKHVRTNAVSREGASGQVRDQARDDGDPERMAAYSTDHARTQLHDAVCAANQAVFRYSRRSPGLRGMGTTLVGALWDECDAATLWLAHVGDSRCYRLRCGTLERLTADHSLVEAQVRAGTLSRVDAEVSPIRNIITRAVGSEPVVEPEIAAHTAQSGDVYLLATDGLTRELEDARIARILCDVFSRTDSDSLHAALEVACHALIDAANAHGGRDNITVLLIGCV